MGLGEAGVSTELQDRIKEMVEVEEEQKQATEKTLNERKEHNKQRRKWVRRLCCSSTS